MRCLLVLCLAVGCTTENVGPTCADGFRLNAAGDECVPVGDGAVGDAPLDVGADGADGATGDACACTGDRPICAPDESCVECTTEADCEGETPMCDAGGTCVACLNDTDCPDADAAQCLDGACVACNDAEQCTEAGQNVCEAGVCFECTETTAFEHCGNNSCDAVDNTCTGTMRTTVENCLPCRSDAECVADHACVPMNDRAGASRGSFCLRVATSGCSEPFLVDLSARDTISGTSGLTFCGINEALATCEAVLGLLDNARCDGGEDTECPEGGICRTVGVAANRCTYACSGTAQCDRAPNPGRTCGDGGTGDVDYCGG